MVSVREGLQNGVLGLIAFVIASELITVFELDGTGGQLIELIVPILIATLVIMALVEGFPKGDDDNSTY